MDKKEVILLVGILLVIILCVFVLGKIYYAQKNNLSNETKNTNEVIEKRTYNTRTFRNPDGTLTTEIGVINLFFFDGKQYVELEKISNPKIDKKLIILNRKPKSNIFDFGTYKIHEGINVSLLNGNLILDDFNGRIFITLPRPFSTDANGNKSIDNYLIDFKNQTLKLFVEVNKTWLDNAKYPIEVDPYLSTTLSNTTGLYSGTVIYYDWTSARIRTGGAQFENFSQLNPNFNLNYSYLGSEYVHLPLGSGNWIYRSFLEFNISSISNNSIIINVTLQLNIMKNTSRGANVSISRFNESEIKNNVTYPDNFTGNEALFNNISTGYNNLGYYIINSTAFQTNGTKNFSLGQNAINDLKSQLINGFFGIGLKGTFEGDTQNDNDTIAFDSGRDLSSGDFGPKLYVVYSDPCSPPGIGDWFCNTTCIITGQVLDVNNNLYVYDHCLLQLKGGTNLTFVNPGSYIYIYRGGEINVYQGCSFNA